MKNELFGVYSCGFVIILMIATCIHWACSGGREDDPSVLVKPVRGKSARALEEPRGIDLHEGLATSRLLRPDVEWAESIVDYRILTKRSTT